MAEGNAADDKKKQARELLKENDQIASIEVWRVLDAETLSRVKRSIERIVDERDILNSENVKDNVRSEIMQREAQRVTQNTDELNKYLSGEELTGIMKVIADPKEIIGMLHGSNELNSIENWKWLSGEELTEITKAIENAKEIVESEEALEHIQSTIENLEKSGSDAYNETVKKLKERKSEINKRLDKLSKQGNGNNADQGTDEGDSAGTETPTEAESQVESNAADNGEEQNSSQPEQKADDDQPESNGIQESSDTQQQTDDNQQNSNDSEAPCQTQQETDDDHQPESSDTQESPDMQQGSDGNQGKNNGSQKGQTENKTGQDNSAPSGNSGSSNK